MARDDPSGFVRVVANILPDKLEVEVKHQIARIERVIVQVPQQSHPVVDVTSTQHDCDMAKIAKRRPRR
jgi:hypothetical protein